MSAHICFVRIVAYKHIELHRVRWSSAFHQNGARARCQKQPPPKYTVYAKHVSLEAGDSDAASSDTESASSSSGDEGSKQGQQKAEPPGFFILQHRNAQDNIRVLSEQKLKVAVRMNPSVAHPWQLTEENKKLRAENESLTVSLNRANNMSKTQVNILKVAQQKQVCPPPSGSLSHPASSKTRSSCWSRSTLRSRRRASRPPAARPRPRGCATWLSRSSNSLRRSGAHLARCCTRQCSPS